MRIAIVNHSRGKRVFSLPPSLIVYGRAIALTLVQSSNVGALGFDKDARQLVVVFKNGAAYLYHHFPETSYVLLMAAPSKGGWLAQHVVGNKAYPYERLPEVA